MSIFYLKIVALIFMVLDHIAEFFPNTISIGLRWMGRLAAPIFIFCVVEGLVHTSNRKKYFLRLYIASAIMGLGSFILNTAFSSDAKVPITNNVFATLFLIVVLITGFEAAKNAKQKLIFCLTFFLIQGASLLIIAIVVSRLGPDLDLLTKTAYCYSVSGILPNIIFCDGSFLWVILGVLMYCLRKNKRAFIIMYIIFSFVQPLFTISYGLTIETFLYINYQWMMIAALPFILSYNGNRGKRVKYFFYIFYPLQVWLIFILSCELK